MEDEQNNIYATYTIKTENLYKNSKRRKKKEKKNVFSPLIIMMSVFPVQFTFSTSIYIYSLYQVIILLLRLIHVGYSFRRFLLTQTKIMILILICFDINIAYQ